MQLRPRGFGESLNEWFRSLGRNWKRLLTVAVVTHLPVGVVVAIVFMVTGADAAFVALYDPEVVERLSPDQILDLLGPFLWAVGVWMLAQSVAAVAVYVGVARVVAEDTEPARQDDTLKTGRLYKGLPTALAAAAILFAGSALVAGLAALAGFVILDRLGVDFLPVFLVTVIGLTVMVVLVWAFVSVAFSPQVVALEEEGPVSSLRRSFRLVQSRWWPTLGFLLVASLIASAAGQLLGLVTVPFYLAGFVVPALMGLAYGVVAALQGPVIVAVADAYALWYLDLRSREQIRVLDQTA